ncbi:hypothetical protein BAUCODRAFT_35049 [Baudoinia panamericana UAMH 10762]|uniref:Ribosomal protein/NADH dehydrogenase domain-containing protein n=1 Tax=Baudoinia panamericana (strain UAMH 10762) TaxID=717646 RepID=M2N8B8_BAUPA|nr:uncharacterized protein BAUCODRAFT_35049 [Baudoinia panamericana UAMH 10762]EMC95050.1 hypothetical protein BAUCODRAFT_35049 [Baudoinia panamericana UAMH 10762]
MSSSMAQRMRKMQARLLAIRLGSGAFVLPKDVKRIHMRFAAKLEGGHMGPRKFWRHELVRLKYHNPAVSMTVDRTARPEDDATLSIHYARHNSTTSQPVPQTSSSATSAPNPPASTSGDTPPSGSAPPTERVQTIDMKHRTNSEILDELVRITKAHPIEPTEADREELRMLEEQSVRSAAAREKSAEYRAKVKREQDLLEQARRDVPGQVN